jgi:hypothetical protein
LRELNILKYYRLTRKWVCKTYGLNDADLELPTSERSVFYNNKSYTDKVYNKAIDDMIKDKER